MMRWLMRWLGMLSAMLLMTGLALALETAPNPAVPHDPLLAWLQAAGFPTWAVVLLVVGRQVSTDLKDISSRLEQHVRQTERRLSWLEYLARKSGVTPPAHEGGPE